MDKVLSAVMFGIAVILFTINTLLHLDTLLHFDRHSLLPSYGVVGFCTFLLFIGTIIVQKFDEWLPKKEIKETPVLIGLAYFFLIFYVAINYFVTSEMIYRGMPEDLYRMCKSRLFSGSFLFFSFWPITVYSQCFTAKVKMDIHHSKSHKRNKNHQNS